MSLLFARRVGQRRDRGRIRANMLASVANVARVTLGIDLKSHNVGAVDTTGHLSSPWAIPADFIARGVVDVTLDIIEHHERYNLEAHNVAAGIVGANVTRNTGQGTASLSGVAEKGQTLTCTFNDDDPDGAVTVRYQWVRGNLPGVDIVGATLDTYTLVQADVGHVVRCSVIYDDAEDNRETIYTPPSDVVISVDTGDATATLGGSSAEGGVITCTFHDDDPDGPATGITYQWFRDGVAIPGATSANFALSSADIGHSLKCRVNYTDGTGNDESIFTADSAPITAAPNITATFKGSVDLAQNSNNPMSFPGQGLGTPSADRKLLAMLYAPASTAQPDQLTMTGPDVTGTITFTKLLEINIATQHHCVYIADAPTGTLGNFSLTWSATPNNIASLAVYELHGAAVVAVYDSANSNSPTGATSATMASTADGFVAAMACLNSSGAFTVTSDLSEDHARAVANNKMKFLSHKGNGGSFATTVAAASGNKSIVGVSLRPTA